MFAAKHSVRAVGRYLGFLSVIQSGRYLDYPRKRTTANDWKNTRRALVAAHAPSTTSYATVQTRLIHRQRRHLRTTVSPPRRCRLRVRDLMATAVVAAVTGAAR